MSSIGKWQTYSNTVFKLSIVVKGLRNEKCTRMIQPYSERYWMHCKLVKHTTHQPRTKRYLIGKNSLVTKNFSDQNLDKISSTSKRHSEPVPNDRNIKIFSHN